ncbi:Cell division protein DivIC (FtsB), stabilizes FtsL against RasP cleavage [hydrothermal vent metagenome]|uniref:Cell division protein DivIC (FtsB), stabilizes FtsL against RasP cleavage n=1 Tax=hydrothermal vent metagenome TaxID=652676 RepID=A0A3B0XXS2_9ZZZZ
MRWLGWLLFVLLLLLQYRLWVGDGSLAEVWDLYQQVEAQREENRQLQERNQTLEAEVQDLKKGLGAIEERAREELGMIKKDETFYQIIEPPATTPSESHR